MSYFDPGNGEFIAVDGQIVEKKAHDIALKINDYDENIVIMCIDPSKSEFNEAPFVICEQKPDGRLLRIFETWELDERVLERIYAADTQRHNIEAAIAGMHLEIQNEKASRYKEKVLAQAEVAVGILKSPLSSYSVKNEKGDLVHYHENQPPTVNKNAKSVNMNGKLIL